MTNRLTPEEAIARLVEGNRRFSAGLASLEGATCVERRITLAKEGQNPFAIIFCCSDSRVPAEIVFDCGLGDLFVVRNAGNVVSPTLLGSIELAAIWFESPLCLVMGHSNCGAIAAAIDHARGWALPDSPSVRQLISQIAPAAQAAIREVEEDRHAQIDRAVRHNVRQTLSSMLESSRILQDLVADGRMKLAGAVYDLGKGTVSFDPSLTPTLRDVDVDPVSDIPPARR